MTNATQTIAIIGGGITGLVCGYRLTQAGHRVTIFEKNSTLGGLTSGVEFKPKSQRLPDAQEDTREYKLRLGQNQCQTVTFNEQTPGNLIQQAPIFIEQTYHHIFQSDTEIIALITELGLVDRLIWCNSSVAIEHNNKLYPFTSGVDLIKFSPLSFMGRIRFGLSSLYLKIIRSCKKLATFTADEYLQRLYGKEIYETIWKPLLIGKFHYFYNKVSMAWIWARINARANIKDNIASKEKLGYLLGGFQTLIDALAAQIENAGSVIYTNTEVEAITTQEDDNKIVVTTQKTGKLIGDTTNANQESRITQKFDKLIFTGATELFEKFTGSTPTMGVTKTMGINQDSSEHKANQEKSMRQLETPSQTHAQIDYLGVTCLLFSSTQNLTNYYWVNITKKDHPFLVFIQHTNLISPEHYLTGPYSNNSSYTNAPTNSMAECPSQLPHLYYLGTYIPHQHKYFTMPENDIINELFSGLKQIFPQFDQTQVTWKNLFKSKYAQHIVDTNYQSKIPSVKTHLLNAFLLNFSQIFPHDRGMNFAVKAGNGVLDLLMC